MSHSGSPLPDFESARFFDADPQVLADPHPFYEAARKRGPIVREPGYGVFVVTRYADILEISQRTDEFSAAVSAYGPWAVDVLPQRPEGCPFGQADVSEELEEWRKETPFGFIPVLTADPPRHTDLRSVANRLFTQSRQKEIQPRLREMAVELAEDFVSDGKVEFVSQFSSLFPFFVITELFGIPREEQRRLREQFRKRSEAGTTSRPDQSDNTAMRERIRNERVPGSDPVDSLTPNDRQFLEYMHDRRTHPQADILTQIATARFRDGTLPAVEELVEVSNVVYGAGLGTTTDLLTNAMQLLAEHPDLQNRLREQPSEIPAFIDEVLRFASPVQGLFRFAKRDSVVDGVQIPAGSVVWLVYAAANRDPENFEKPFNFDPQ
ncbi:MAG TPA: hypothetical protein DGL25_00595, partial [Dehalococcoidia bacterium]|nr:hypothetical protein [Dehalococcoidia bacterium]